MDPRTDQVEQEQDESCSIYDRTVSTPENTHIILLLRRMSRIVQLLVSTEYQHMLESRLLSRLNYVLLPEIADMCS